MSAQFDFTTSLKRKASRWQMLPDLDTTQAAGDVDVDDGRYSLLLFLRDLDAKQGHWNEFIQGLQDAPGAIDENGTIAAVLAAALETKQIQYDYVDPAQPNAKKRRITLAGNRAAEIQLAEHDALIRMARTVWPNPDDLQNVMGKAYRDNLRQLTEGGEKFSVDAIFDFARSWSEVRYRFMNHALRDDPSLHEKYDSGRYNQKGNSANKIVHESNLTLDAKMVEFQLLRGTGFNDDDRRIFEELYMLTPEEARRLTRYTSTNSGLRIGLPDVFRFCINYINAYMDWRVRVLESARKQLLGSPAYRNANGHADKRALRSAANQDLLVRMDPVDSEYPRLVDALRKLVREAETINAFNRPTYDELDAVVTRMTTAVRGSVMNRRTPELQFNSRFQNETAVFPGPQIYLTRPTGTSLIAAPRRRPGT